MPLNAPTSIVVMTLVDMSLSVECQQHAIPTTSTIQVNKVHKRADSSCANLCDIVAAQCSVCGGVSE